MYIFFGAVAAVSATVCVLTSDSAKPAVPVFSWLVTVAFLAASVLCRG